MFVAHGNADLGECVDEQWFEVMLGEVAQRRGGHRELLVALAFVGQAPEHRPAQLGHPMHRAGIGGVLRLRTDGVNVEADLAPDLERARVDGVGGGRALWSVAAFHDRHRTAQPLEQERGSEPDGTGADDQDIDVYGRHQNSPGYEPPSR